MFENYVSEEISPCVKDDRRPLDRWFKSRKGMLKGLEMGSADTSMNDYYYWCKLSKIPYETISNYCNIF